MIRRSRRRVLGRWRRPAGMASAIAGAAVLFAPAPVSASAPQLNVTGSSFAGVAIQQWEGQFNEIDGGSINFTVSSSVIGMNEFCAKSVDFGAADIAYSTQQSNCNTNQVPYPFQYMPDVAGGLAFVYNLTSQSGQQVKSLVLNAPALTGIFTGQISYWDNSTIAQLNPQVQLPHQRITPYYRSDPSGENYLLSDYFLHTNPGPITDFQNVATIPTPAGQPSATWASFSNGVPSSSEFPNLSGLVGANGSDAASQGPVHTQGGIAYVETAYAKNVGLPVASVVNQAGYGVQPTSYNVATALTKAILYSDLTQNLGYVYTSPDADAYPISAYSYFLAQCVPSQAAAQNFACDSSGNVTMGPAGGAELAQFITFVACLGQARMADLGYSPLPPNLVEDDFQAAGRLPGGTTPPPPNASNCKNPYITGQLQPLGEPTVLGQVNPGGSDVGTGSKTAKGATPTYRGTAPSGVAAAGGVALAIGGTTARGGGLSSPYTRADALDAAATSALKGWTAAKIAFWSILFVAVVVGLPLAAWLRQRRRGPAGSAPDSGGAAP